MIESHPLVRLARQAIELYVTNRKRPAPPLELDQELLHPAGAFVTIHRRGELRGCIGTIQPTCGSLAEEVIQNAISAATRDPRFPPISLEELEDLDIKVDVLSEPEEVHGIDELDPRRYGLIIQSEAQPWRRGLLLPDLEGIDSAEKQVYWTRYHKAGITDPKEPVKMYRFEVRRLS